MAIRILGRIIPPYGHFQPFSFLFNRPFRHIFGRLVFYSFGLLDKLGRYYTRFFSALWSLSALQFLDFFGRLVFIYLAVHFWPNGPTSWRIVIATSYCSITPIQSQPPTHTGWYKLLAQLSSGSCIPPSPKLDKVTISFDKLNNTDERICQKLSQRFHLCIIKTIYTGTGEELSIYANPVIWVVRFLG